MNELASWCHQDTGLGKAATALQRRALWVKEPIAYKILTVSNL